ncbi:uncharacterized protein K441DRAFT_177905 [Cenococcum geophilum 1.58]|uniref:uncharacterized protein n=1 Tax=Cenococcum geophilum 1.58 TaxID=794803 RepID=UPI00358F6BC6|nr:hypothetical protein K441DRAFT_177905 [Cenococcum geophilum 1.58]
MASTVTIGKTYFEALLRRAEFHTSSGEHDTLSHAPPTAVTISKAEHDHLVSSYNSNYGSVPKYLDAVAKEASYT